MFKPTKPQHIVNKKYMDGKTGSILPPIPEEDGTYMLTVTVDDGEAELAWATAPEENPAG